MTPLTPRIHIRIAGRGGGIRTRDPLAPSHVYAVSPGGLQGFDALIGRRRGARTGIRGIAGERALLCRDHLVTTGAGGHGLTGP